MISELKIRNFKSLESVDLKLGHFNLLVGANASGKSNFLDALRFLQGVGNGFTISEILDGKPPTATSFKWDGIRGGSKGCCDFAKWMGRPQTLLSLKVMIPETNLYSEYEGRIWDANLRFSPEPIDSSDFSLMKIRDSGMTTSNSVST